MRDALMRVLGERSLRRERWRHRTLSFVGCYRALALARIQSTTSCSTHATAFDEIVSKLELSQFMSSGESHRDRRGAEHCGREC